eukprot:GHVT01006073.1.p1 GENE.GHVT01006073.1~~GHVT01006073.1.p1  ORF type:complete len:331 (-),score=51.51 GHVT01006073.1:515-1507(-)
MVSVRRGSMLRDEQAIDPAKIGMADSLAQLQVASMTQKEDLVLFHGTHLLTSHKRSLGDQVWSVMEKVLVAALEYGQDSWAVSCASALVNRFPSSNRVSRLIGMAREAAGDWEEATNIYTDLLKGNPADTLTRKRLITVFISQRRYHEAIEALNAHLEEFAVDAEAWQVLGAIYLAEHRPLYASYCFEELLLHNPRSLYHVITYAEVQASLGHRLLAHKYFALALAIDGENPRALWGLVLVNEKSLTGSSDVKASQQASGKGSAKAASGPSVSTQAVVSLQLTTMALDRLIDLYARILHEQSKNEQSPSLFHRAMLERAEAFRALVAESD